MVFMQKLLHNQLFNNYYQSKYAYTELFIINKMIVNLFFRIMLIVTDDFYTG